MNFNFSTIVIDPTIVLRAIDCDADNPIYDTVYALFDETMPIFQNSVAPVAAYAFCENILEDYPYTILALYSLGCLVSDISDQFFREGLYMKGLLMDTIADCYLMQMDKIVLEAIEADCIRRNVGTTRPFIPAETIDAHYQKQIVDHFPALLVSVTKSFMLSPVKSMTKMIGVSQSLPTIDIKHNCARCALTTCKWRT